MTAVPFRAPPAFRTAVSSLPASRNPRLDPVADFVAQHQRGLWRWLRALGCEAAAAEEHCQDAMLAALQHGIVDLPVVDARRWLRTAARNLFWMQLRAEHRRPRTVPFDEVEAAWRAARGDADGGEAAARALDTCLQGLEARERELLAQRYQRRNSRAAMAQQFGMGEAGVKQALRRVRAKLKACMESGLAREDQR
jgi:RNA polymerase sigma-70 factor, ECF subfamily